MAGDSMAGSRRRIPDLTTHHDAMSRQSSFPWQAVAFTAVAVVCTVAVVVSNLPASAADKQLQTGLVESRLYTLQQEQAMMQQEQAMAQQQQFAAQPQQYAAQPQQYAAQPQQYASQPQQYAGQVLQGAPVAGEVAPAPMAAPMEAPAPAPMAPAGYADPAAGTCAEPCTEQFKKDSAEIAAIQDQIELSQCDRCEPPYAAAGVLQTQLCALDTAVSLHQAGGSCQGFASNFCQTPFSANFCTRRTWVDPLGSEGWLNNGHEIQDPGEEAAKAGADLAAYQQPAYANDIATNLVRYLTSGAAAESSKAHLKNVIAEEIEAFKPVKKEEGLVETVLPFMAPPPSKREKKVLHEDAKLQAAEFGRPIGVEEAHEYGAEVEKLEAKMTKDGVRLPPDEEKELDELAQAADKYNRAPSLSAAPLLALFSSLVVALLSV